MSRQRTWAINAHDRVKRQKDHDTSRFCRSYNTHCKKGPSLLQRAGTMQALAFLMSRKEEDAGRQYADDLAYIYYNKSNRKDGNSLLVEAQAAPFEKYLILSRDLLAISAWLRRFAQIELASVGEDNG